MTSPRLLRSAGLAAACLIACWTAPDLRAHLCNDVFAQAKDNLAVKVDIRDGQLRVAKDATFRVYLLNTMDRPIANINLEVEGAGFTATVKHDPNWREFPQLKNAKKGGKKEYFEVTVARKSNTPDGRYNLKLRLFNGQKPTQEFKTVDLDTAAAIHELAPARNISIDGNAGAAEWGSAFLCTDFLEYAKSGQYFQYKPCQDQPRVRVAADEKFIYCLMNFQGGTDGMTSDTTTVYLAASVEGSPVAVSVDRLTGEVKCDRGTDGIVVKKDVSGSVVECKIPREKAGLAGSKDFFLNAGRTIVRGDGTKVSFWRGNEISVKDPVVFDRFVLK